jgi:flavin reductase (DIM6/NTAB) family NADH-FMN oxidoreductase RutF
MPISGNKQIMFAVALRGDSTTAKTLKKAPTFSLNWLDFKQRKIVTKLSSPLPSHSAKSSRDKLGSLGITYKLVFGAPVLESASAYAICEKARDVRVGDHRLCLGRLLGAMASLDFDQNWKFKAYRPILYIGSTHRDPFTTLKGH